MFPLSFFVFAFRYHHYCHFAFVCTTNDTQAHIHGRRWQFQPHNDDGGEERNELICIFTYMYACMHVNILHFFCLLQVVLKFCLEAKRNEHVPGAVRLLSVHSKSTSCNFLLCLPICPFYTECNNKMVKRIIEYKTITTSFASLMRRESCLSSLVHFCYLNTMK